MSLSLKLTMKTSGRASHALTTSPILAPAPRGQLATDFRGPLALLLLRENRLLFFLGAASSAWPWLSGGGTICLMASVSCVNSSLLSHLVRAKGKAMARARAAGARVRLGLTRCCCRTGSSSLGAHA